MKKNILFYFLVMPVIALFSACGGSESGSGSTASEHSDGSSSTKTTMESAYLIDSPVNGVKYKTESSIGLTKENGKLVFKSSDKSVKFHIGSIVLGEYNLSKLPSDHKILISELLGFPRNESNNAQVIKALQFLQSLDSDKNPLNGITIDDKTAKSLVKSNLDFRDNNLSIDDINTTLMSISKDLVSQEKAVTYFEKSLQELGFSNDSYAPIFLSPSKIHVNENVLGSFIVNVLDASNVTFALSGTDADAFTIDSKSGLISFKKAPDYETKKSYFIRVSATDANGQRNSQNIKVEVNDIFEASLNVPTLVVVMNWTDYAETDASDWYNKFFNRDSNSVNRWFKETTAGTLNLVPVAETSGTKNDGIIMVSMGKKHPGGGDNTKFRDTEIVNAITSKTVDDNVDFAALDRNKDGVLNQKELQIIFIVSGGEMAIGDKEDHSIWAHSWSFPSKHGPEVDGVHLMQHSHDPEKGGSYARFGAHQGDHQATIGVIAHELGHSILDLKDYYDTGKGSGLGWYDVMSGGGWARKEGDNYAGETPTGYSAYNRIDSNLDMNVTNVSDTKILTLRCSSKDIIKLITSKENEYFLIACRDTAKHYSDASLNYIDSDFTEDRLFTTIYHVDSDKNGNKEDGDQTADHHYKVALLEKDTQTLMTSKRKIYADYDDVYIVGDKVKSNRLVLYDGTKTGYSLDVQASDYDARTMTIKITKSEN